MSRQKLFNMIKSRGSSEVGRNPFDLSNRHVYTQKAAKITPVKFIPTVPKDYFEVSMAEFSQNKIPMNTAAFLNGIKELSAYYVPYNTIWHNFNQYIATREDPDSAILQEKGIAFEPRIAVKTLYGVAFDMMLGKVYVETLLYWDAFIQFFNDTYNLKPTNNPEGDDFLLYVKSQLGNVYGIQSYIDFQRDYFNAHHEYDLYGAAEPYYTFTATFDTYLEARKQAWLDSALEADMMYTIYENQDLSMLEDISSYEVATSAEGFTRRDWYMDRYNHFRWCDWLQKLDMFGYSNLYPLFKPFINDVMDAYDKYVLNAKVDLYTLIYSASGDDKLTTYILDRFNSVFNDLVQALNGNLESFCYHTDKDGNKIAKLLQIYPLYAYNKIFYDMFRNVYYDLSYNVRNYNVDFLDCSSLEGSIVKTTDIPVRFYSLETHQWKKDMFTGILPDNQLGDVSSLILGGSDTTLTLPVSGSISGSVSPDLLNSNPVWDKETTKIITPVTGSNALESYINSNYQIIGAGGIISSSGLTRFENNHVHTVNDSSLSISHSLTASGDVSIGSSVLNVLALKRAEAIQQYRQDLMRAGNRTRDIFHQLFGSSPKSELDESPYFIEAENNPINVNPIISTAETGDDKVNGKLGDIAARVTISGSNLNFKFSTEDFGCIIFLSYVVPESMYNSYRIDPNLTCLSPERHGLKYFQNLGLAPVIGEFLNNLRNSDFTDMTLGFAPPYLEKKTDIDLVHGDLVDMSFDDKGDKVYQGALSHWVVARTDMQNSDSVTLRNFYIDPSILDNVFTMLAGDDYDTDHFITYSSIVVNAVRAFSEIGLPRFV